MGLAKVQMMALGAAVIGGGLLLWKVSKVGAGLVTGNNALTQSATDGAGRRVTAYEGAGVVGTLGAAANAASGGYLASFGQWLGNAAYDLTHGSGGSSTEAASYDESARLAARYPVQQTGAESIFSGVGSFASQSGLDFGTFEQSPFAIKGFN